LKTHKISTTVFDSQGRKHNMNVTLSESPVANKWAYSVKIDNQVPTAGGSGTAIFDEDGSVRSFTPTEGEGTLLQFAPDGDVQGLKIDFSGLARPGLGINGLTQFAAPSTADVVDQNGRASGRLDNLFIRTDGVMEGRFTNGETLNLARINLANFDNAGGLRRLGGNLFAETENTGNALIEIASQTIESTIVAESLELSNVDLAQEFVDLITSQRGFQANARVVTTTDQIMAETVNLKQ
jgi:flagellar hook protein FlgE